MDSALAFANAIADNDGQFDDPNEAIEYASISAYKNILDILTSLDTMAIQFGVASIATAIAQRGPNGQNLYDGSFESARLIFGGSGVAGAFIKRSGSASKDAALIFMNKQFKEFGAPRISIPTTGGHTRQFVLNMMNWIPNKLKEYGLPFQDVQAINRNLSAGLLDLKTEMGRVRLPLPTSLLNWNLNVGRYIGQATAGDQPMTLYTVSILNNRPFWNPTLTNRQRGTYAHRMPSFSFAKIVSSVELTEQSALLVKALEQIRRQVVKTMTAAQQVEVAVAIAQDDLEVLETERDNAEILLQNEQESLAELGDKVKHLTATLDNPEERAELNAEIAAQQELIKNLENRVNTLSENVTQNIVTRTLTNEVVNEPQRSTPLIQETVRSAENQLNNSPLTTNKPKNNLALPLAAILATVLIG